MLVCIWPVSYLWSQVVSILHHYPPLNCETPAKLAMGLRALGAFSKESTNITKIKLCGSSINVAKEGIPNMACNGLYPTHLQDLTFQVSPTCQGLFQYNGTIEIPQRDDAVL